MSLLLASGSSQYLERASVSILVYPYAISAWVYVTVSANGNIVGIFNNGSAADFEELVFIAPNTVQLRADDGGTSGNSAAVGVSLDTWHHVLGIWTSASSRRIYLDGSAGSNLTSTINPTSLNVTTVGRQSTSAPGNYISARVAEFAAWNLSTVLTTNEINMLALGVIPSNVRFSELVEYHPMLQDLDPTLELIGANGLTQFAGPIVAGHPPLILLGSPFVHTSTMAIELSVGNTITFGSVGWDARIFRTLASTVTFGQALVIGKRLNVSISNIIRFWNTAQKTIENTRTNTITFSNRADRGEFQVSTITFGNTVTAVAGPSTSNVLTFGNSVSAEITAVIVVGNTVTFAATTLGVDGDPGCEINEYNPVGPDTLPEPTLSVRDFITFSFSSFTLDLRNPDFGDVREVAPRRVFNLSRGGTPNPFKKSTWPNKRNINFSVRIVLESEKTALLTFLEDSLGQEVTYIDPESRSWIGVILNPEMSISQLSAAGSCSQHEISISFRGEPV